MSFFDKFKKDRNSKYQKDIFYVKDKYCMNCGSQGVYYILNGVIHKGDLCLYYCHDCGWTIGGYLKKVDGILKTTVGGSQLDTLYNKEIYNYDEIMSNIDSVLNYIESVHKNNRKEDKLEAIETL